MSTGTVRVACLQLSPGNDLQRNLIQIGDLVAKAAADGAAIVALPEFAAFLDRDGRSMRSSATTEAASPVLTELSGLALRHAVWLLLGSLVISPTGEDGEKLVNRSFLIDPEGRIVARYDKIHLFDARLADGRIVGESRVYRGGSQAVLVDTPFASIGMTICYDLRFPALYRTLAQAGAQLLFIPSAFTAETGSAHWQSLLRARAIETGAFVLAPATCGLHPGDWKTHGHAAIIDPWGEVLAQLDGSEIGYCISTLDLARSDEVRARIPAVFTNPTYELSHVRMPGR